MSDSTPSSGTPDQPVWDTAPTRIAGSPLPPGSGPGTPGTAGGGPGGGGSGRRTAVIAAVSVAVAAILGGGAFAAVKLMGGGPQPDDVLPASTIALLSVDLDPSAGQKIEAIRTIRKFPGLKKHLGIGENDDLRKVIFDKATEKGPCKGLSFDQDVKPWLGDRAAFGAVDLGGSSPSPVVALQVSDAGKARTGIDALVTCGDPGSDFGYTVSGDYAIISDSTAHARSIAAEAKSHPLSDDASYQKWTSAAGDAGVVGFYVAPRAATLLADNLPYLQGLGAGLGGFTPSDPGYGIPLTSDMPSDYPTDLPSDLPSDFPSDFPSDLPTTLPTVSPMAYHPGTGARQASGDPTQPLKDALKKFKGLAGTVRFADGGVELEVAGGFDKALNGSGSVGSEVQQLPKDTALAFGLAVPSDYASSMTGQIQRMMGAEGRSMIDQAQQQLGITLPGDLQTLLGKAVTVSLGGDAPSSLSEISGPADLPLGFSITGDPAKIQDVISRIEQHTGQSLDQAHVVTRSSGDRFTLATTSDYADQLAAKGSLGDQDAFKAVVPDADKASAVLYLDFDSGWADAIAKAAGGDSGPDSVKANLAPLKALGLSSWVDGGTSHALLKITTD